MKHRLIIASTLTVAKVASSTSQDNALAETVPPSLAESTQATNLLPLQPVRVHQPATQAPERLELPPERSQSKTAQQSAQPSPNTPKTPDQPVNIPTIVPPEKLPPLITATPVNDRVLSHQTEWNASASALFHPNSGTITPDVQATYRLDRRAERRITPDGLRILDYRADYILLDTPTTQRRVTIDVTHQIKTLGQHLQFSLTGTCSNNPAASSTDQCAYTPGLTTDNSPEATNSQGNPSRIIVSPKGKGAAFDIVTPENLAAIEAPEFQQGLPSSDPRSQQIGVDLTTPNIGTIDSKIANYRRTEEITPSPAVSLVRVRRIVSSSSDRAQLAQTVRGISLISDLNTGGIPKDGLIGTGIMGLAQLVPDVRPSLKGNGQTPTGANENLFIAANSAKLPPNSFTAYHGGLATADNRSIAGRDLSQTFANFNSVWIGLSPLVDRRLETSSRISNLVRQETLFSGGQEGGSNSSSAPSFDVLLLDPNLPDTRLTPANLSNFYSQLYLTFFTSSGQQFDRAILTEKTRFVPSIAFTGNFASQTQLFQYYVGAIVDPDQFSNSKGYIGAAYSGANPKTRWAWKIEGQGVLQPNPDYYSYVSASVAKGWQLGKQANSPVIFLSTSGLYSFDRPVTQNQVGLSPVSFLSVGTGIDFGRILPLRLGLDYSPGIFGDNGVEQTLLANAVFQFNDRLSVTGFYAPIADSSSRVRAGLRVNAAVGRDPSRLRFWLGWSLNQYDLAGSTFNDNQFIFGIRVGNR